MRLLIIATARSVFTDANIPLQKDGRGLHCQMDDGIVVVRGQKGWAAMAVSSRRTKERRSPMTTSEYFTTPESVRPAELVYGLLRVAESPVVRHQRVVRDLTFALHT